MKKAIVLLMGVFVIFGLCGCGRHGQQEQPGTKEKYIEVSVSNCLEEADIWIIADTLSNRNTTVWGTATLSGLGVGETEKVSVRVPENDADMYLIRMIDTDDMFYAVDGVVLGSDMKIVICKGHEPMSAVAEVYDKDGNLKEEYTMFGAKL